MVDLAVTTVVCWAVVGKCDAGDFADAGGLGAVGPTLIGVMAALLGKAAVMVISFCGDVVVGVGLLGDLPKTVVLILPSAYLVVYGLGFVAVGVVIIG